MFPVGVLPFSLRQRYYTFRPFDVSANFLFSSNCQIQISRRLPRPKRYHPVWNEKCAGRLFLHFQSTSHKIQIKEVNPKITSPIIGSCDRNRDIRSFISVALLGCQRTTRESGVTERIEFNFSSWELAAIVERRGVVYNVVTLYYWMHCEGTVVGQ